MDIRPIYDVMTYFPLNKIARGQWYKQIKKAMNASTLIYFMAMSLIIYLHNMYNIV